MKGKRGRKARRKERTAALDSTMLESHHVSRHFEKRQRQTARQAQTKNKTRKQKQYDANRRRAAVNKRLPKLSLAVQASSHLILAAKATTGLGADHRHFVPLMLDADRRISLEFALADAGYDSEDNHRLARDELGIRSLIPATCGRPGASDPAGHYRRLMRRRFKGGPDKQYYGQRWQAEIYQPYCLQSKRSYELPFRRLGTVRSAA